MEIVGRELLYTGYYRFERLIYRHPLFAGGMSPPITREVVERGDAVAVLPYDPELDVFVMIEQARIGARDDPRGPRLLEVVAGMIEPDESIEDVARRETLEEAGCTVTELFPFTTFYINPANSSQRCHVYCGKVDASRAGGVHGLASEGEDIRTIPLAVRDVFTLLEQGRVDSGVSLVTLLWFARNEKEVRERFLRTTF